MAIVLITIQGYFLISSTFSISEAGLNVRGAPYDFRYTPPSNENTLYYNQLKVNTIRFNYKDGRYNEFNTIEYQTYYIIFTNLNLGNFKAIE